MAGNASRTIMVTVKTAFQAPEAPRNVRFEGTTFGEMKERLSAVNLPGISGDSFVEVRLEGGGFLCLLDAEQLPEGDLVVNVHNYSKGDLRSFVLGQSVSPVIVEKKVACLELLRNRYKET